MLKDKVEKLVRSLYIRGAITSELHMKVVEDATIAEFREESNPGIRGSDAGKSLRRVLEQLVTSVEAFEGFHTATNQFSDIVKTLNFDLPVEVIKPTKFYVNTRPWERKKKR